ncbi:hypothetical protein ABZ467_39135 [Streptomyces sp. NPDC005727]|uniref:MmyB family transcriptional regulator n=1 Tax=unclassified Streptomyces TaxID=2593676 RepID=UPI0033DA09A8
MAGPKAPSQATQVCWAPDAAHPHLQFRHVGTAHALLEGARSETIAESVAHLRAVGGAEPDDSRLVGLVSELQLESPEFASMWERYEVRERGGGTKRFAHPEVGDMTLTYEMMRLARTGGQRLVVYQARPGTPDEKALRQMDAL